VHRIVLVKLRIGVNLAHQNDDRRGASEERVPRSLVGLPGIDEMGDALLEELAVDLDLGHDGRLYKPRDWR
jgi:hypothetical protein